MTINDIFDCLDGLLGFFSIVAIHLGDTFLPALLDAFLLEFLESDGFFSVLATLFDVLFLNLLDVAPPFLQRLLLLLMFGFQGV